jgi:hypothetical protein
VKKKEFPYLPTHTSEWWVGLGQTKIFLSLALSAKKNIRTKTIRGKTFINS